MQIIFKVTNPRQLTGAFVYQRTNNQTISNLDEIDSALLSWAVRLSASFSTEPYQIESYPSIDNSNFSSHDYNSTKQIKLIFRCFNKIASNYEVDKENISSIKIFFDSADQEYINKSLEEVQYICLSKEAFENLNTLIMTEG